MRPNNLIPVNGTGAQYGRAHNLCSCAFVIKNSRLGRHRLGVVSNAPLSDAHLVPYAEYS